MPLLLTMSVCGGLATLIYIVLEPLMKRFLPLSFRRHCLRAVMCFYIIPFAKFMRVDYLKEILGIRKSYNLYGNGKWWRDTTDDYLLIYDGRAHNSFLWLYILLSVVFLIALTYWGYRLYQHHKIYRYWKANAEYSTDNRIERYPVVRQGSARSPFVIGLLRPVITIPQEITQDQETLVLCHELQHIKQHDNLWKVLFTLIVLINMYNPFIYVAFYKWTQVSEMLCDKRVIDMYGQETRIPYGEMLVTIAGNSAKKGTILSSFFSPQYAMLRERLKEIMRERRTRYWVGLFCTLLFFIAICPTLLYHPVKLEIVADKDIILIQRQESAPRPIDQKMMVEHPYVEEGHELVEIDGEYISADQKAVDMECNQHDLTACRIITHHINEDGSCYSVTWDGLFCPKCIYRERIEEYCTSFITECMYAQEREMNK